MKKEDFVVIITDYIQARDAMLSCMETERMPDCTACDKFGRCKTRLAWTKAYNAMNRVVAKPPVIKCRRCDTETRNWVHMKSGPEAFLCEKCRDDDLAKSAQQAIDESNAAGEKPVPWEDVKKELDCDCGENCECK